MSAQQDDYLGYKVYAQTLWARIARSLEKDAYGTKELGDDPLVVGIFGEWGAGKSKLLSLIQAHAIQDAEIKAGWRKLDTGNCTLTVPVFFQPWKYEHEEHLHVPILLHILAALEQELKASQTWNEAFLQSLQSGVKEHLGKVVGAFSVLLSGVALAMDTQVPLFSRLGLALAGLGATAVQKGQPEDKGKAADTVEFKANGRFFYEMHQTLQAITRPSRYAKQLTGVDLSTAVSINFVLFIDDLDRCLPEKAVEALELIKTVFNLESFAFVLALDEEVVERGIGHRYRDYNFKDKKPEMPITGFEYLEKIVHLPFRLPALTREQAYRFLVHYEQDTLLAAYKTDQYSPQQWMIPIQVEQSTLRIDNSSTHSTLDVVAESSASIRLNLASLVLESFTAYVPRKLIRALELFHQVLRVLQQDGRIAQVTIGGELDPRLLLAMVMIQLFQPELYRSLRREQGAFAQLWAGFEAPSDEVKQEHPHAIEMSSGFADADLLYWAVLFSGAKPPASLAEAASQAAGLPDWKQRFIAQRQRLPVVQRLLEHRSIGRLAFDPLALMQVLRGSHVHAGLGSVARGFVVLSQVLDESQEDIKRSKANSGRSLIEVVQPAAQSAAKPIAAWRSARPLSAVLDVNALFVALLSDQESVQQEAASSAGLAAGQCLQNDSAQRLLQLLKAEKSLQKDPQNPAWQARFMRGMQIVAPHVPDALATDFWDLVKDDSAKANFGTAFESIDSLHATERWADVRSTLGQDDRFDPALFYLPNKALVNYQTDPVPGFVHVPASQGFAIFKGPPIPSLAAFHMARYLTTVDQFAGFIQDKGYEKKQYWDDVGWDWIHGDWDKTIENASYKQRVSSRAVNDRRLPIHWQNQLAHGSRAVWGVSWFEARAYCRWLGMQLKEKHAAVKSAGLPSEAQWERAARASTSEAYDQRQYAWSDTEAPIFLRANINASKIGRSSAVGLFAPSSIGLSDLSGNLWEWQSNVFTEDGNTQNEGHGEKLTVLRTQGDFGDWKESDHPALRGGSWCDRADFARASVRYGFLPDGWGDDVGFRVVLSLA